VRIGTFTLGNPIVTANVVVTNRAVVDQTRRRGDAFRAAILRRGRKSHELRRRTISCAAQDFSRASGVQLRRGLTLEPRPMADSWTLRRKFVGGRS
jgi:hypothetical protein